MLEEQMLSLGALRIAKSKELSRSEDREDGSYGMADPRPNEVSLNVAMCGPFLANGFAAPEDISTSSRALLWNLGYVGL